MIDRYPKSYIIISAFIILGLVVLSFTHVTLFNYVDKVAYDAESLLAKSYVQNEPSGFAVVVTGSLNGMETTGSSITNSQLAELIGLLKQGKVKDIVIGFPVIRENPNLESIIDDFRKRLFSMVSINGKKTYRPRVSQYIASLKKDLDSDSLLIRAVKGAGNIIFALPVYEGQKVKSPSAGWTPKGLIVLRTAPPRVFKGIDLGVKKPFFFELYDASAALGHCLLFYGDELPQRMHLPFVPYGDGLVPSLPVLLAMRRLGSTPSQVEVNSEQMKIGSRVVPLVKGKVLLIPSRIHQPMPVYSAFDILATKKIPVELRDKSILLTPRAPLFNRSLLFTMGGERPGLEVVAGITENIINGPYIGRPKITHYIEVALLLLMGALAVLLFPRAKYLPGLLLLLLLMLLSLSIGWAFMSFVGIWLKVSHMIVASFALFVLWISVQITRLDKIAREAIEANRLLGLNFQKQGIMDLAFERFKLCPLNNVTRDLIYELAQECEARGLNSLAIQAYGYILKKGEFRDASQRMVRLQSLERFPGFDSQGARKRDGPLSESFIKQRKLVGRYQVIEPIGKGTMGYVYKAVDSRINRPVALKIIRFSDEFDAELISEIRDRFFREAEIAGKLNHPSIVTVYDVGEDRDLTYMAMEYLQGKDLELYCEKQNLLPLMKVLEVVYQVADALEYAHTMGVIHRDIKPANIMLLNSGSVKVTDFGIAKAVSSSRTKTGVILGTPNYMSPEQIMGHKMDARSDIFSLGVLFFQLLTGELPFRGDNLSALLYQITQGKHPSVRQLRPRLPRACEQIIDKALAKSPSDRFKSARDMKRYINLLMMRLKEIKKKYNRK